MRLHSSKHFDFYSPLTTSENDLVFVKEGISAGFPSPAEDFLEQTIDLNKELIKNPETTFLARVKGNSLKDIGITDGDIMIIDKSLQPKDGKIAVCFIDGDFTVKRIKVEKDYCLLLPANSDYKPIKVTEDNDFRIWGIVINVIKYF